MSHFTNLAKQPNRRIITALAVLTTGLGSMVEAEEVQGLVFPETSVAVASPVEEIVREVMVKEGDAVDQGHELARLDSAKEVLEVQLYDKQVEQREFVAKGMQTLLSEKMVSREAAFEKRTDFELAIIQRDIAKERLKEKTIRSPLAGIVVKKYKESGEAVERVEKMFDIVSIDRVVVQFYLEPKFMVRIEPGNKVPVRFPVLDNKEFETVVSFVDPRIDAASGLFRVKLLLENPGHDVKAGMRGTADFDKLPSVKN